VPEVVTGAEELVAARQRVEHLLLQLPHQEAIRPQDGQVAFETAWEIRAFAMAVAAYESGQYTWPEFQEALVDAIRRWEEAGTGEPWRYYDRWLEALESLLADARAVDPDDVAERTHAVLTTPRDASHHRARRDPVAVDGARR
jgi:nitrile hydratase accessory protein